jgi:hypothetical protein
LTPRQVFRHSAGANFLNSGVGFAMNRTLQSWPYPRHKDFEPPLKKAAARWFAGRGYPARRRQPHILDSRKNWHRNIIVPEVAEHIERQISVRKQLGQAFALHKWVHHGLSSQALLFNLVGPLVVYDDFAPLREALAQIPQPLPALPWSATFEFENRKIFNEKQGQPTSVDLVIEGAGGSPLFIECKFVETEFGGCSVYEDGDCPGANPSRDYSLCYLHRIGRRYWTLMEKHGLVAGPILSDSQCILAIHYQFFRELLLALESGGQFVLLHDERSPTFCFRGPSGYHGLMPLLLQLLPAEVRSRVGIISIRRVVEHIKASGRHPWISDFEAKYGLL